MKGKLVLSILGLMFALILVSMVTAQGQPNRPPPPTEMKFVRLLPSFLTGQPLRFAQSTWTQTNGPYLPGGNASALAAHPLRADLVLAAVGPGSQESFSMAPSHVYRTTNGGADWTAVYTAPSGLSSLAFTGTIAYAGGFWGIHTSADSGLNWTHVFIMDDGWVPVIFGLAADPQTPSRAFAAGSVITVTDGTSVQFQATLHRTTDGGTNWTRVYTYTSELNAFESFMAALVHPVTSSLVLATYQNGLMLPEDQIESVILRSAAGGDPNTWTPVYTAANTLFTSLTFNPAMPDRIYATGYAIPFDGGMNLYRSDDAGENWTAVVTDGSAGEDLVASADGSTLFGTSYRSGVVTGTAEGDIWSSGVWAPGPGAPIALTLDSNASPEKLYVGLMIGGVFTSTNGAASFSEANNGIEELAVGPNVAVHPSEPDIVFAAWAWCSYFGFRTADAGDNWNQIEGTPHMIIFAFKPDAPDIMLGGGCNNCSASLLRSTDGGLNWTEVYTSPYVGGEWPDCGPGNSEIRSVTFARGQTSRAYAVGMEQTGPPTDTVEALFLRSTDGGLNWVRAYTWDFGWPGLQVVAADPMDANIVYAGGGGCPPGEDCQALFYKSKDGGENWSPILTTTDASYFVSLVIDYWNPLALYVADSNERIWKSSDGGENWTVIHEPGADGLPSGSALALDPWVPSILYVASTQHVIRSEDGGENFTYFGRLYEISGPPSLAIGNDPSGTIQRLYAGSLGVWRYDQTPPGSRIYLPLVLKNY